MARIMMNRTNAAQYVGSKFVEQTVYDQDSVKVTRSAIADKDLGEAKRLVSMAINKVKDAMKSNYRDESYDEDTLLDIRKSMEDVVSTIDKVAG